MVSTSPNKSTGLFIITIDGPAGAGKSTAAKALSKILRISYLDTGAMYRALTLKALRKKVNLQDEDRLAALVKNTTIDLNSTAEGALQVLLDTEDVTTQIRSREVTNNTFYIARAPKVREIMVEFQRAIARRSSIVAEGRDVGTVVFPRATVKFYLDADFEERSQRRVLELEVQNQGREAQKLKKELEERDHKDLTRGASPLRKADDAIFIDSTFLSVEETVQEMLKFIKERIHI